MSRQMRGAQRAVSLAVHRAARASGIHRAAAVGPRTMMSQTHIEARRFLSTTTPSTVTPSVVATPAPASSTAAVSPSPSAVGAESGSAGGAGASGDDAGAQFELAPSSPSTWRRNVFLAALVGGFAYHLYSQRQEFERRMHRDVISCVPTEVHDLINVFHFTTKDMESLYAKTMQR